MTKKTRYDLEPIRKEFVKEFSKDKKSLGSIKAGKTRGDEKSFQSIVDQTKDFERRGYRWGTTKESLAALYDLSDQVHEGEPINSRTALWFLNAINEFDPKDPKSLLHALGLIDLGRSRVVNPFDVANRVDEIIAGGSPVMRACHQAAEELGCSYKTAHHWYTKKRKGLLLSD